MRTFVFAKRNIIEIIRDPITVFFGLCFPIIILLLLTLLQSNIPVDMFQIEKLAPGIAVFGLSFMSLFSGMLIAKDRTSSFLIRLYSSPAKPYEFILGYVLPFVPLSVIQSIVCFAVSAILGLKININIMYAVLAIIPVSLFYIGIGILCGSFLTDKQVGGICGALLTNISAWLSGIWFDLSLMGETLERIAYMLPFANAVEFVRGIINNNFDIKPALIIFLYSMAVLAAAILVFSSKMRSDKN